MHIGNHLAACAALLLLVSAPTPSHAAVPSNATLDGLAEDCGIMGLGKVKRVEQLGKLGDTPIYQAHMSRGKLRVLFFGTSSEACQVYKVGRAIAGDYGKFMGDGERRRVFALPVRDAGCGDTGDCDAAVIVRNKAKDFLAVGKAPGCNWASATTIKGLLPDRDGVLFDCASPGGGDVRGHHQRLFVVDGKLLKEVATVHTGYSEARVGDDAPKGKTCRTMPAGYLKVTTKGKAATLKALAVEDDGTDGKLTTLTWDAAAKSFKKTGESVAAKGERKQVCK